MSITVGARTRNKIFALLATGLVVGVGASMTLASWTDTEWVYGGDGLGGPGVGTSTFDVEQDAANPFAAADVFGSQGANPGNPLSFGTGALALSPGDVVYAPVALRTTATSVSGGLVLQAAVAATGITVNDPGNTLRDALQLRVGVETRTGTAAPDACDAAGFASYTDIGPAGTGLFAAPSGSTQALQAAGADILHYCFQITLPLGSSPALQGHTVAPAWQFLATSD